MQNNWRHILISTVICIFLAVTGCRFPWPGQPRSVASELSPAAKKAYSDAVAVYQAGDYAAAAERFAAIRENTSDRRLARMALYGLACSQFMLAETPEAHIQALELWQGWFDNAPNVSHSEDVRLVDPLIREKMLLSNLPPVEEKAEESEPDQDDLRWLLIRTKQELDRLREQVKAARASSLKRQKRISALKKEISKLKRQIIALEAIDQKIQEKKTTIPAAEQSAPQ